VVQKFTEIFAVEAGDFALKTLPYGGIYLVGGVTMGLSDYIEKEKTFTRTFYKKGRLGGTMRRFPIMILRPDCELGMLGAEEQAYRLAGSY
jgi:glucokinase